MNVNQALEYSIQPFIPMFIYGDYDAMESERQRGEEAMKALIDEWRVNDEPGFSFDVILELADRNRELCDQIGEARLRNLSSPLLARALSDNDTCAGIGKLFGKRGVFYEMVGQEVSGLDGFYDHEFQEYGEFGIRIPENPGGVCDEIEAATGVQAMIVDANDLNVEILGKASSITLDEETLKGLIRDNPAGQSRELTPFILIRPVD